PVDRRHEFHAGAGAHNRCAAGVARVGRPIAGDHDRFVMPTETLHFENARVAQQLFNNDPRNLQALDHQLGVKATAREGWIKLEGETDALDRAKQLFLLLEHSLQAGSPVRNRDFSHALSIVKQEGVSALKDLMTDRIQTSEKKGSVTAKT